MRIRLLISAILIALYGVFRSFYTANARYIVEAQLAPLQVGNDTVQYGLSRNMTIADFVGAFWVLLLVSTFVFMWVAFYLSHSEPKLEPSKLDRFFMRHFSDDEPVLMPTETAVSVPTTTPNS